MKRVYTTVISVVETFSYSGQSVENYPSHFWTSGTGYYKTTKETNVTLSYIN